jgi:hypothetical protein
MILPTRFGNTEGCDNSGLKRGNRQLTVNEVVSYCGTVTKTIVIDVATGAIKVFGDGDQIANGGRGTNVREKLSAWTFEANLLEVLQPFLHNRDLGFEILIVGCVVEAILDVDQRHDHCSVPKRRPLLGRVKTIDQTGAKPRSKQRWHAQRRWVGLAL